MKVILHLIIIIICSTSVKLNVLQTLKNKVLSTLFHSRGVHDSDLSDNDDIEANKILFGKTTTKNNEDRIFNVEPDRSPANGFHGGANRPALEYYHKDPVLNFLKRRTKDARRKNVDTSSETSSSSLEMEEWKDEWRELWLKKKFEALNSSTPLQGDVVNMVAARPWGVACGDPNQHDMPWGTCMLAMECEAEYRIYRGDYHCGRTQFVCCALQLTTYDAYQAFDVSFADSALSTDSEEKRNRGKGSRERRRRKKRRDKKRRKRNRLRRKRKIKKNIRKIIKEIKKVLNRAYRNGTTLRKKKTKQLKKFIRELKKKYKKERQSVKDIHEIELIKIDNALQNRLNQIRDVNENFAFNRTFRQMIVNGTVSKKGARQLIKAYPELSAYFNDITRRRNGKDYLDYDVEYGFN